MPTVWNRSVLYAVLKKGDPTSFDTYRGISLIPIAYKILSAILCESLKPSANTLIAPYQCGFITCKSTIDQIKLTLTIFFVDYKATFDSSRRDHLYAAMSEFCQNRKKPLRAIRYHSRFPTRRSSILWLKAGVHRSGTIFNRSVQLLAYADDIDIIGRCRDVKAVFTAIQKESEKLG